MTQKKLSRRDALKLLGTAIGVVTVTSLPAKWVKPALAASGLPVHALQSVGTAPIAPPVAHGSQLFSTPSKGISFVVPAGVTSLTVDAYGAQGGDGGGIGIPGGMGGYVTFTISVTPGETLTVSVGGKGPNGSGPTLGGANGGGDSTGDGGGGGGWSGVSRGATMLVVAGGGGGSAGSPSGGFGNGGVGGGISGGAGTAGFNVGGSGGGGGTQGVGGAGGGSAGGTAGTAGSAGLGGTGGSLFGLLSGGGGGGGGGPKGGGGGGGGSSYPVGATHTQGVRTGDGQVTLTW